MLDPRLMVVVGSGATGDGISRDDSGTAADDVV